MGGKGRGSEGEAGQKFGSIVAVSAMLGYTDGADIKNPVPVSLECSTRTNTRTRVFGRA